MSQTSFAQSSGLRLASVGFLVFWCFLAAFPLLWIVAMSFKLPLDAFSSDPLDTLLGPVTKSRRGGISTSDLIVGFTGLLIAFKAPGWWGGRAVTLLGTPLVGRPLALVISAAGVLLLVSRWGLTPIVGAMAAVVVALLYKVAFRTDLRPTDNSLGKVLAGVVYVAIVGFACLVAPHVLEMLKHLFAALPGLQLLANPLIGATGENYSAVWIDNGFFRNFQNSLIVTLSVTTISLTVGTLAGYALSRMNSQIAFWLLIMALVFRALPHSVLVTGYLPPFINSRELLQPLWNTPVLGQFLELFANVPPTFYGQPYAVIAVLVSINQPFTIWMLRSFFKSIPTELDEAARIDGCTHMQAFTKVIMPVMWPGVITTGLFSFLLAYNDYLICSLLLSAQNQTMVPAITQYFNSETTLTDQVEAVAAAVSITAPLFLLVTVFQRQIVSGLTAGAVKG